MSFAITAVVATVATSAYLINKEQKRANELQEQAQQQAVRDAKAQATATENQAQVSAANRVKNNKTADASAIMADAQARMGAGGSGTMLTGPQGIDPSALSLSKSTLLGM